MIRQHLESRFPNLGTSGYSIESPQTINYNCIAWTVGDTTRCWWPDNVYFWPSPPPREVTVDTLVNMFERFGYSVCGDAEYEDGFEKIAIYADPNEEPTHAARQLPSGRWTSKLGRFVDIEHTIDGLDGSAYGSVAVIMRRPSATTS